MNSIDYIIPMVFPDDKEWEQDLRRAGGRRPAKAVRFLYANDDMFPLSPLEETDFFRDGKPCQRYVEKPFPESPDNFHRACLGGLNFVAREFGKHFSDTWLKGGHTIVWFGTGWNLELYVQANARLHRQGQEKPVMVYRLIVPGTVDEIAAAAIDRKDGVQGALLNGLTKLMNKHNRKADK